MQALFPFNFNMFGRFPGLSSGSRSHARLFLRERDADSEKKTNNTSESLSSLSAYRSTEP
jgi:hypothetical protein